ncbi:MAG: hypothetical protein Q9M39_10465, partial [Sulfurovum sp.]|nr:hypothetical protein [Sulfurovum sp.]
LFHVYWMLSLAEKANGKAMVSNSGDSIFRTKVFMLKILSGTTAGFIVWLWFLDQADMPYNQIDVIAFIAGLSGEGFLGLIRKMAGFST